MAQRPCGGGVEVDQTRYTNRQVPVQPPSFSSSFAVAFSPPKRWCWCWCWCWFYCCFCSATGPPQTKVYVGNVDARITTEFLKNIFQLFGNVVGAEMKQDPNNPVNSICSVHCFRYIVKEGLVYPLKALVRIIRNSCSEVSLFFNCIVPYVILRWCKLTTKAFVVMRRIMWRSNLQRSIDWRAVAIGRGDLFSRKNHNWKKKVEHPVTVR